MTLIPTRLVPCLLCLLLCACDGGATAAGQQANTPVMRWDHRMEAAGWTQASLAAMKTASGAALPATVPADIDSFCPAYSDAGPARRRAFWAGLFSALAKHESTWNPEAVGGGGRYFGLMQISPATARHHGCAATSGAALLDGGANLRCAIRIAASSVSRDGVVAADKGGVAADWGPMTIAAKRDEVAAWTRAQDYCRR